jgi:two-component system sensor histidine kinase DesK
VLTSPVSIRHRYGLRYLLSGIWLVYLFPLFPEAWDLPNPLARWTVILSVVAFCGLYLAAFALARGLRWAGASTSNVRRILYLVAGVGLSVLVCALVGEDGLGLSIYASVLGMLLLPGRLGLIWAGTGAASVMAAGLLLPGWGDNYGYAGSILLATVAIWGVTQMINRNVQLALAHEEIARLAVAQERTRFARDLHDLLGHSLTVVTVKAELAGRLVALDPERAEKEIGDVERLARDALADVRAAVSGYREVTLARELVSARMALEAAGIVPELPGAVDDVPGGRRELFGWAVREGTTNVVRHSSATHCRIVLTPTAVEVIDDGTGPAAPCPGGSGDPLELLPAGGRPGGDHLGTGLTGLRERADDVGASVTVGRVNTAGGFRLRVGW